MDLLKTVSSKGDYLLQLDWLASLFSNQRRPVYLPEDKVIRIGDTAIKQSIEEVVKTLSRRTSLVTSAASSNTTHAIAWVESKLNP